MARESVVEGALGDIRVSLPSVKLRIMIRTNRISLLPNESNEIPRDVLSMAERDKSLPTVTNAVCTRNRIIATKHHTCSVQPCHPLPFGNDRVEGSISIVRCRSLAWALRVIIVSSTRRPWISEFFPKEEFAVAEVERVLKIAPLCCASKLMSPYVKFHLGKHQSCRR